MSDFSPYTVRDDGNGVVLIKFRAGRCGIQRMKKHEDEITELVNKYITVKYDLSETTAIGSEWMKWIARMTLLARSMGKEFLCTGMSESIKNMSEVIGLHGDLELEQK